MSINDFSRAWDEAARRALETSQENELLSNQLSEAAGMRVRTDVTAGLWHKTNPCTKGCFWL